MSHAQPTPRRQLDVDDYVQGVLQGDRAILGRALTLIERNSKRHRAIGQEVLLKLLPHTGNALRIGITGTPGAGKSTFINQFGLNMSKLGYKVTYLYIDTSSQLTGGYIYRTQTR